ncbi:MAG: ABC-F family ATP-binding cassette domain-containing protein [Treponema sp.]|jgi:ATP-binding cassette subfamily F protein 3|nr:ABC-F family ATP-binding cassette domain-containing protein [Treponema sp.]
MAFVQCTRVSLAFGDRDILKGISFNLSSGSRSALAGANGSGKSTLMRIIAGNLPADSGDWAVQKGCRISYLPQSGIVHRGRTLREEAETAYAGSVAMLSRMEEIGRSLERAVSDDGATRVLLDEYQRLREGVENSGYYQRDQQIALVLSGLGFAPADPDRPVEEFSGGWQMRIALAKALLESPDILLLDEPTNYLDIEARSWLESTLRSFPGGYLLVSHDRYFLDVTVNEVYELFQGNLKRYAGNYSTYEKIRAAEMESLLKRWEIQQDEIAKTEALVRRFRYKASKAAFVQELVKRLDRMERIEIPESLKKINISFPPSPHSGRIVLTLTGIGKSYGPSRILSGLDLTLEAGERLVVVGPNGAGKSTLLRILAGADRDFEGTVQYGAGVRPGYFSQDAAETIGRPDSAAPDAGDAPPSVLEFMEAEAPTHLIPRVRDMLGAFLFRGDDVFKPLPVLSGGEKSRLALLKMLLKPMNLLILDEPTNHLDIYSKDILLKTLESFGGTIVFVSHDRAFMEALSTKTLELSPGGPGRARLFYGNYAYYLERLEREGAGGAAGQDTADRRNGPEPANRGGVRERADYPAERCGGTPRQPEHPSESPAEHPKENPAGSPMGSPTENPKELSAAEHREAVKQRRTCMRRLERQEAEILKALETLEAEKTGLEAELARPAVYSSGEKARAVQVKLNALMAAIETKTREWEEKAGELALLGGPIGSIDG